MRPTLLLTLLAALASTPAGAQPVIRADGAGQEAGPNLGPNARAVQRPMGPNALAAKRPAGPNSALAEREGRREGGVHYPSCSAAGAARAVPIRRGEPGYGRHLDPDGDGVACE